MNCLEARRILLKGQSAATAAGYQVAREHLEVCEDCQAQITQLLAQVGEAGRECDIVTDLLPHYVSDELQQDPVAPRHSYVRRHLASCPRCSAAYRDLRYLLLAEADGDLVEPATYPSFQLPFLRPQPAAPQPLSWTIRTMRDAQQRLSAVIAISQAYVSSLLAPPNPAWARSSPPLPHPVTRYAIVDDIIEEENWVISVELQRPSSEANETWDVHVSLATSTPTAPMRATLSYNGETPRHALLDDASEAVFRAVPGTWITGATSEPAEPFHLTIEPVDT